ncbi:MAG TPA: homoserine dehydrogenase [Actinomycetota bacterium]|nr:homoserine dehydrogenase [Actinomycetota bacterium]
MAPAPLERPVRIGLLGCGTVGGATASILLRHASDLEQRTGVPVELRRVAVRDASRERGVELPEGSITMDPWAVVKDPAIDVVVETIGGLDPARELVLAALAAGKHVVTANKELIATHGRELLDAAASGGVDVLFEAAVGGGIPVIRSIKESLAGDRLVRVMGIVNGTTNFILTRMSEDAMSFEAALAEAQGLGYAEADPTADVEGHDAASKLAILATLAFGGRVVASDVRRQGIANVTAEDVAAAHDLGYEVKLLAVAERDEGQVAVRVHPAMVPKTHPLASVREAFNAVFVEGEEVGELMLLGRGAGGAATASAVVGDVVELARNLAQGAPGAPTDAFSRDATIRPPEEARVRYYLVLSVLDQSGVLAAVAGVFARHDVSIASVRQEGSGDEATLVLITHTSTEGQHQATFDDLAGLDAVKDVRSTIRVEGAPER